jgi:hypothetical protein
VANPYYYYRWADVEPALAIVARTAAPDPATATGWST